MANYDFTYTGTEIQAILDTGKKLKDSGYIFLGVATPSTNPGTPTQKVYYEAKQAGTYTNFGGVVLPNGISLLKWNGSWTSETVMSGDGGVFDISVYKSTGGTLATFADLSAALDGGNNIPASARKGGMSVKYVQSSDNKYVRFNYLKSSTANADIANVANWQGVDDVPTVGSNNLVESGGVVKAFKSLTDSFSGAEFGIGDHNGNVITLFKNGGIKTKNFDSENVKNIALQNIYQDSDFDLTDENYYSILRLSGGHIQTKYFNSENVVKQIAELSKLPSDYVVKFSDFKNQENTDDDAIANMLLFSSVFKERTLIIDENITISKAILLPSDTTVIVDGITIRQADYSFDNVFRGANVPWNYVGNDEEDFIAAHDKTAWTEFLAELPESIAPIHNIKIIGKNGAKIIGNNNNATIHYIYGDDTQPLIGDFFGIRTHQMNFSYVDGIEISGFELTQTRGWAISFDICKNIEIHDMVIISSVKNGDGIDFRYGCKNAKCYNISGSLSDDVVACTCLPDMNETPHDINGKYMFGSEASRNIYFEQETLQDLYIDNISIQNVSYRGSSALGHGIICLSAYGGKVQNIYIENVEELTGGIAKESVIKIYTGYGTGYTSGDLNKIHANKIKCINSTYAVVCNCVCDNIWLNKLTSDTSLTQIEYMQGFTITNSNL